VTSVGAELFKLGRIKGDSNMLFRTGGIYLLPNGRELLASGDGSTFYATADEGENLLRYELNESGRLLFDGRLTAWSAQDLRDTQQTADESRIRAA
jgi:hypothetical protein